MVPKTESSDSVSNRADTLPLQRILRRYQPAKDDFAPSRIAVALHPIHTIEMASLSSLRKRYERNLRDGDFYGAEQACRMMHHRLTQGKTSSEKDFDLALSTLQDASVTLLSRGQTQAGAALGLLSVKHCVDYKVPVSDKALGALRKISEAFPSSAGENAEAAREKLRFLRAALAWTARNDCGGYANGHAKVNAWTAEAADAKGDFELAQQLYVRSDAPEECATFLYRFATNQTLESEHGLVLARCILRYLVSDNLKDAIIVNNKFAELSKWNSLEDRGSKGRDPPPLGNFCELLVKLCQLESAAGPLFSTVSQKYRVELERDPNLVSMTTKVGSKYFRIEPPQPAGMAGMMNSMLRGMMGN